MTDPPPLTGDELAAIKARAEAATPGPWEQAGRFLIEGRSAMLGEAVPVADVVYDRDVPHIAGMDPETTLRLVAEVERLRAQEVRVREVEASVRRYRLTSVADDIRAALDGP
jgi:hypothetical protein